MSKTIITVSPSSLNETVCSTRYYYSRIRRLTTLEPSEKIEKGSLFHKLAEQYYNLIKDGVSRSEAIQKVLASARTLGADFDLEPEQYERTVSAFRDYALANMNDQWQPIAVEAPFSKILYDSENLQILGEGKIDLLVNSPVGRLVVDLKTSDKDYQPSELDNQVIMYCWALDSRFMCIDKTIMQKTQIKFNRAILNVPENMIEEWKESTIYTVKRLQFEIESGMIDKIRNYRACNIPPCLFRSLCKAPKDMRDWKISVEYRIRDPHDLFKRA